MFEKEFKYFEQNNYRIKTNLKRTRLKQVSYLIAVPRNLRFIAKFAFFRDKTRFLTLNYNDIFYSHVAQPHYDPIGANLTKRYNYTDESNAILAN